MFKPVKSDVSGNIEVTADISCLAGQTLTWEESLARATMTCQRYVLFIHLRCIGLTCFVCFLFVCLFQRLQKKFDSARDRFSTLQSIVDSEIAEGTSQGSKSCTLGLLWLKRSFLHKST